MDGSVLTPAISQVDYSGQGYCPRMQSCPPVSGSVKFSSVSRDLCDPMNRGMPGLLVHHQLPEFTQTHVHRVGDTIQPSHPLSSPSPPALNLSQHQVLFKWVSSLHQVAKVLEFQLQHQSHQLTPYAEYSQQKSNATQDWSPLGWTGWISLQSKGLPGWHSAISALKRVTSVSSSVLLAHI